MRLVLVAIALCSLERNLVKRAFSGLAPGSSPPEWSRRLAERSVTDTVPKKQIALVTGANKGIGKEIARKLASIPGTTVILGCRNAELAIEAINDLTTASSSSDPLCAVEVVFSRLDLTDTTSVEASTRFIRDEFGQLDILVNNAAICFNDPTLYGKVPYTSFQQQANITVQTNYFGTIDVTQQMLPLLRTSLLPRIINVASAAGRLRGSQKIIEKFTSPSLTIPQIDSLMKEFVSDVENGVHAEMGWPNTCYGVSKMGLIAFTRVLAREEQGIIVNSVDPGFCATDQNQHQGYITAERGARTALVLAQLSAEEAITGRHFFEEQEISWSYQ